MFVARLSSRSLLLLTNELVIPAHLSTSALRLQTAQPTISGLHKNISIKRCTNLVPGRHGSALTAAREFELTSAYPEESKRPLSVLLTWLNATERNIEKYRGLWLQKGFDVLTVKMNASQLLLPNYGSIPMVRDLVKFLYSVSTIYPDVVLHCFSVGAYQFGEMMAQLNDPEFLETVKAKDTDEDPKSMIERLIKGIIFDSPVNLDGISKGVSRAMTDNPALCKTLEVAIDTHLKLAHPVATVYYERASEYGHGNTITHAPGLLLVSEKDHIGAPEMSQKLMDAWVANGIDVRMRVFKDSGHVQHFAKYPVEYKSEVDSFLKKLNLASK